jgi:thiol-disulfide isomerase/thioredoxin
MKPSRFVLAFALLCFLPVAGVAQVYHVELPTFTMLDDMHLTVFSSCPEKSLLLPHVDTTGARFFTLFYSWKMSQDPDIAVMVIPKPDGEQLYIDLNNNLDLSDDGPPSFFPAAENDLWFDLVARNDPRQRAKLLLQRKPALPDSVMKAYVDTSGNLHPQFARVWGGFKGQLSYEGKRGTFYFDNRVALRKGNINVSGISYEIALFDYSNNGLFNDDDDLLFVDVNRDGRFSYQDEVVGLTDVFALNGRNFVLSGLDKYGASLDLKTTTESPTFSFLQRLVGQSSQQVQKGVLDDSLWSMKTTSLDGDSFSLQDYRGKYVLLNFWGEWCKPCLAEIPVLVEGRKQYAEMLQIIGFLSTTSVENSRKVMKERGMDWPQIILSDKLEKEFNVRSYPTNVLILPDGKQYMRVGMVTPKFFESFVH